MPDHDPQVQYALSALERAVRQLRHLILRLNIWIVVAAVAFILGFAGVAGAFYQVVHESHVRQHDQCVAAAQRYEVLQAQFGAGVTAFGDSLVGALVPDPAEAAKYTRAVEKARAEADAALTARKPEESCQ